MGKNTKEIPLFPECLEEQVEDKIIIFKTNVYLHKDTEDFLKVYLYTVESTYIATTPKEKILVKQAHFRECLRLSKYLNTDVFDTSILPFVTALDKREKNFLDRLHYQYT